MADYDGTSTSSSGKRCPGSKPRIGFFWRFDSSSPGACTKYGLIICSSRSRIVASAMCLRYASRRPPPRHRVV